MLTIACGEDAADVRVDPYLLNPTLFGSMSIGEGAGTGFSTMRGRDYPAIRQFTVFLENRVGQLLADRANAPAVGDSAVKTLLMDLQREISLLGEAVKSI